RSSPVPATVILYVPPDGSRIVSGPGLALARLIASRSDSVPPATTSSANVLTVNTAGVRRSSRHSREGRNCRDGRDALADLFREARRRKENGTIMGVLSLMRRWGSAVAGSGARVTARPCGRARRHEGGIPFTRASKGGEGEPFAGDARPR